MLRLQAICLREVEHLLGVVTLPLVLRRLILANQVAILLVIILLEALHQPGFTLLHKVLNLRYLSLHPAVSFEGFPVLLLRLLEVLDQGVFFFVDQVLVSVRIHALVGLFSSQTILGFINLPLLGVRRHQRILHFRTLLSQLLAVLFEGILVNLAVLCLPFGEHGLLVRRSLWISALQLGLLLRTSALLILVTCFSRCHRLLWRSRTSRCHANGNALALDVFTHFSFVRFRAGTSRCCAICGLGFRPRGGRGVDGPVEELRPKVLVEFAEDGEGLIDHSETRHLNVLHLTLQVHLYLGFQLLLFVRRVLLVLHPTSTGQGVMHRKLLLEILDLPLILPYEELRIQVHVHRRFVCHLHHASRKAQRAGSLF
mmetsp:Transcript_46365/g.104232  ORF Transcript_46365/g.104232 Transcript_46365/m.104232 type:complete len:370 (-) Transcript_46365:280-1389(-)